MKIPSQNLLMNKLSIYNAMNHCCADNIPIIGRGICYALSTLYSELSEESFGELIMDIVLWDGEQASLDENTSSALNKLQHAEVVLHV